MSVKIEGTPEVGDFTEPNVGLVIAVVVDELAVAPNPIDDLPEPTAGFDVSEL